MMEFASQSERLELNPKSSVRIVHCNHSVLLKLMPFYSLFGMSGQTSESCQRRGSWPAEISQCRMVQ